MLREKREALGRQPWGLGRAKKNWQTLDSKQSARWQRLSPLQRAWCRVLDTVAEQREALDFRVWRVDPSDTYLEADVQTWCELTRALADFLETRSTA